MNDKEQMRQECLGMVNEVLPQYKFTQIALNAAVPGMGDMLIDILVEELSKLRPNPAAAAQNGEVV